MPYVKRNEKGEVIELHDAPLAKDEQWIEANSPEIIGFLQTIETTEQAKKVLSSTDNEMVRVVEDLIDLLMERQIFIFTELPEAVQIKLNSRKQLRVDMSSLEGLINDDDAIF
jgi:hypothetical protein